MSVANVTTIVLEGELTIYRAAELKAMLVPLPAGEGAIELDLFSVDEIDTAGVQLLLLARREAAAVSREFKLGSRSRVVDEALSLLDLHAEFGSAPERNPA